MKEKIYIAALHKIWFTHKDLFKINEMHDSFSFFYESISTNELQKLKITNNRIQKLVNTYNDFDFIKFERYIDSLNIEIIIFNDNSYPEELKNIFNSPFIFYLKWSISLPWIAFIGSRDINNYSKKVIENFIPSIWKNFTIISWWAYGCDTFSHKTALNSWYQTMVVFWSGIDIYYPFENSKLYSEIINSWWWIISIFPIWEKPNPYNFPIRNEIVAWLSKWVFIAWSKIKSWTLITAKLSLDLWKDLFTIPGDIFSADFQWSNYLLSSGQAKLCTSPEHILEEYNLNYLSSNKKEIKFTDDLEQKIYDSLLIKSKNIDDLVNELELDYSSVILKLSIMELSWYIVKNSQWNYEAI